VVERACAVLARLVRVDPPLPPVFTRAVADEAGLTRNQVEQRLHTGKWRRLTHGAFCASSRWEAASPQERHVLLARAALLTREETGPQAMSHVTAALLHGLPVSVQRLGAVWMTAAADRPRSTRYTPLLRREVAPLPPGELTTRSGLPVTSLARTVADCLRHLPVEESVPLADAALQSPLAESDRLPRAHLDGVLRDQASWPYARAAVSALRLVDPRRESVFESRSAIVMDACGLPAPTPQAVILDTDGVFVARVDFLWGEYGVVGEADGVAKYRTDDPVQVFMAERERQARLEELGLVVVRWNWRQLGGRPPEFVVRLRRALAAGDPARFRGKVA